MTEDQHGEVSWTVGLAVVVILFLAVVSYKDVQGISKQVGCSPQLLRSTCVTYTPTPTPLVTPEAGR